MTWDAHYQHRAELPPEELAKYQGKHVAWSLDGTRIVAGGADDQEVFQAVRAAGYDPSQVVFSYIEFPNQALLGGALHRGETCE